MAKDGLEDIMGYLEKLADDDSMKVFVEGAFNDLKSALEKQGTDFKNASKLSDTEQAKLFKIVIENLKLIGILNKDSVAALKMLGELTKGKERSMDGLLVKISNLLATMTAQTLKAKETGQGRIWINEGKGKDDKFTKDLVIGVAQAMGIATSKSFGGFLNQGIQKIVDFFGGDFLKKTAKALHGMADALIEGLAANKFIGGAVKDIFTLMGLMGGQFLSKFGTLGKVMGTLFFGAMQAFGPYLSKMIVEATFKGVGKLIGFLGGHLTKILGAILLKSGTGLAKMAIQGGGSLGELVTAGTTAQKVSAGLKVAGGLGIAAAGIGGALWAGRETKDAWERGKRGNAVTTGLGAGLMGAGGIAAIVGLFSAAVAPIALPLVAIGAAVAGIAVLWKNHSETIKKWGQSFGKFLVKVFDFMAMWNPIFAIIKWIREHWPFGGGDKDSSERQTERQIEKIQGMAKGSRSGNIEGYESSQLLQGKHKSASNRHLDSSKLSHADWEKADKADPIYGSAGQILNLGSMTQRRASEVIAADIKEKGEKSFYEEAPASLTRTGAFQTDAYNKKTGGAYVARGTTDTFLKMRDEFQKKGYDVSDYKITGGIATLGTEGGAVSPHTYTSGMASHFGSLGTVIDTSVPTKDGKKISSLEYTQVARMSGANPTGSGILYEGDHYHVPLGVLNQQINNMTEKVKAEAEQHDISVKEVIEKGLTAEEKSRFNQLKEYWKGKKSDESILKDMGIKTSDTIKGAPWVRTGKGEGGMDTLMQSATGNYMFSKMQQTMSNMTNIGTDFVRS